MAARMRLYGAPRPIKRRPIVITETPGYVNELLDGISAQPLTDGEIYEAKWKLKVCLGDVLRESSCVSGCRSRRVLGTDLLMI